MIEVEKKKTQNNSYTKHPKSAPRRDYKLEENSRRTPNRKENKSNKASKASDKPKPPAMSAVDTDTAKVPDPPGAGFYKNLADDHKDDSNNSKDAVQDLDTCVKEKDESVDANQPTELEEDESDFDSGTLNDTASSVAGSQTADEDKESKKVLRFPEEHVKKKHSLGSDGPTSKAETDLDKNKLELQWSNSTPNGLMKSDDSTASLEDVCDNRDNKSVNMDISPLSESSRGLGDNAPIEKGAKEETFSEVSVGGESTEKDHEAVNTEIGEIDANQDRAALNEKIEKMEKKIEKLEDELREVAALEISLYSVVPEHGSSAHKVHKPAQRLSRLYIHACMHWTQSKRATIASNIVSGLILVARTCGGDVSRLTYWLSNIVVLREMISQAFGSSCQMSVVKMAEPRGGGKLGEKGSPSLKQLGVSPGKEVMKNSLTQFIEDWQEMRTLTAALERIESWIFLRIVDSIWWQTLAPNMQSPPEDLIINAGSERLLGPALSIEDQGSFSIDLWKNAFQDAFHRLCSVRAGGSECGCLPVLARLVMERCIHRLDVAMFNAILRESAHQIPTDPISDPILDPWVLPIPAGDLSFGSGAQLKNSVGNWSRWLSDSLGMETGYPTKDNQGAGEDNHKAGHAPPKCFHLLDELSDLLMLPKDMLMDRSIRKEVCPSITLSLIKRVLCNFSPDEFCPDQVPGEVLEALNAECVLERRLSADSCSNFPYAVSPVIYSPPSSADVAERVAEIRVKPQLGRVTSKVPTKGYTSDEELNDLSSPLASIMVEKFPLSQSNTAPDQSRNSMEETGFGLNLRYRLLQEVWSV